MVKLTAVSIWKWNGEKDATRLGIAVDLTNFGYFERSSVKEMITFVSRTIAKRTAIGQRQTVQHEQYFAHVYNREGLVGIALVDKDYGSRAGFSVVNKILDEFAAQNRDKWRSEVEDSDGAQQVLDAALQKYQVWKSACDIPWMAQAYSCCLGVSSLHLELLPCNFLLISACESVFLFVI